MAGRRNYADFHNQYCVPGFGQDVHAQYAYLGLGTVVEEALTQPEVRLNYDTGGDDSLSGFDRFGRVVDQVWEQYGGQQPAAVDRFQYGYDSAGDRVWRKNVVAHGQSLAFDEVYGLDDLGRLIAAERGYLQSVDPVSLTARAFEQEWGLDGTGNWAEFNEDLDGTGWDLEQTREHNAANEVTGATDWAAPAHDRAGNMTAMPKPTAPADAMGATYDAWNRLVEVSEGGVLIAKFSYDAAGRRILKQLADAQDPDQYIHFFHSGPQVVETREGDDSAGVPQPEQLPPRHQFVWSPRYIDALILRDEYDAQGQLDDGARLFYLADTNFNITAIVGLVETEPDVFEWQVVERYVYSPYGAVTIYTPDWSATRAESAFDNTTLYTGREFDPATGLYYYRARYYHAQLGQFISRDPIGYEAGDVNLYRYVRNGPVNAMDPSGLVETPSIECGGFITVSRWGRPGLQPNDWVMVGNTTYWNYAWSGKWQPHILGLPESWQNQYAPFASGTPYSVQPSTLRWPTGLEKWKGLLGQRQFVGGEYAQYNAYVYYDNDFGPRDVRSRGAMPAQGHTFGQAALIGTWLISTTVQLQTYGTASDDVGRLREDMGIMLNPLALPFVLKSSGMTYSANQMNSWANDSVGRGRIWIAQYESARDGGGNVSAELRRRARGYMQAELQLKLMQTRNTRLHVDMSGSGDTEVLYRTHIRQ